MVREYKFRGQRTDTKEWVYGFYINLTAAQWGEDVPLGMCRKCPAIVTDEGVKYYIIPETVGQYTGLKDKNGKDIYEGDIFVKKLKINHKVITVGSFKPIIVKYSLCGFNLNFINKHTCEILGNIHDATEEQLKEWVLK